MLYEIQLNENNIIQFNSIEDIIESDRINDYIKQMTIFDLVSQGKLSYLEFDLYIRSIITNTENEAIQYSLRELSKWRNN